MKKKSIKHGLALYCVIIGSLSLLGTLIIICMLPNKSTRGIDPTNLVGAAFSLLIVLWGVHTLRYPEKSGGKGGKTPSFWLTDNPKKARRCIRRMKRLKNDYTLYQAAMEAPLPDVAVAAVARIQDEQRLQRLLKSDCRDEVFAAALAKARPKTLAAFLTADGSAAMARKKAALERLTDTDMLEALAVADRRTSLSALRRITDKESLRRVAMNGKASWQVRNAAIRALGDQGEYVLKQIARGDNGENWKNRASAYDTLGDTARANIVRLTARDNSDHGRREAGENLLKQNDPALLEEAVRDCLALRLSKESLDTVCVEFLGKAAHLRPELFRGRWSRLRMALHEDVHDHTDHTSHAPHVDSTQYYDYFRYPDGRTVANQSGRKTHTDGPLPSSDCTEYGHTDTNRHTDEDHAAMYAKFPPAIREE